MRKYSLKCYGSYSEEVYFPQRGGEVMTIISTNMFELYKPYNESITRVILSLSRKIKTGFTEEEALALSPEGAGGIYEQRSVKDISTNENHMQEGKTIAYLEKQSIFQNVKNTFNRI